MWVETDQQPRPDTTLEGLARLKTPFRENGRVTAGNAAGLNDGASAVLLMSQEMALELGLEPKLKWVASAVAAVDPRIMGTAPVPATRKALAKADLSMADLDFIEMNEAFAVQALYCIDRWGLTWDDPRVNVWADHWHTDIRWLPRDPDSSSLWPAFLKKILMLDTD